jgi:DNA invertase Pin-like site-specific DNA recombinase
MNQDTFNNVYIYTRVSTRKQADTGLLKQNEECKDSLQKLKITNFEEFVDIGSSYRNSNTLYNLNRLLRKIQKNDLIVVAYISRLGRNVLQVISALEKVKRKGALIYAVYENLFWNKNKYENTKFQNVVIKAREKSDILSMKAHDVYNHITSNNGYYGKPSYGFSIDRDENNIPILVPNDEEIKIINFIKDQYENKKSTFYHISNILNDKGTNKRGYVWTVLNVKRVYQYNLIDMDSSMNSVYQPDKRMLTRSNSGTLLHRTGSNSSLHRTGSNSSLHGTGTNSSLYGTGTNSSLHRTGSNSSLYGTGTNSSLHRTGTNSSLHRTGSNSSFNAYKKQCIPDSPPQTYKSKFKVSNMSKGVRACDDEDDEDDDEDEDQKYIQNKIRKLDITPKKGYGCTMF